MDAIVEGTSLSHVTYTAANPPSHPNAPTQNPQLPVVLYIARVPGSRDVFLTPLKPREKVVSAEDVQSSLYYVHVDCQDDLQEPLSRPSSVNADASCLSFAQPNGIRRKPTLPKRPVAPPTPPSSTDEDFTNTANRQPALHRKQVTRKPIGVSSTVSAYQRQLDLPAVPKRPLPPIPIDDTQHRSSLHEENVKMLRYTEHNQENNPYLREYELPSPRTETGLLSTPGSLALIRRDPTSNEQWDVASIHDPPVQDISSSALLTPSLAKRTKKGGAPLYLDILTPGYARFADNERPISQCSTASSNLSEGDPLPEIVFRRRLYMPGSRHGEHSYNQHQRFDSAVSYEQSDTGSLPRSMRQSADVRLPTPSPAIDHRTKSYTFRSPWNGQCEFSTGTAGRSLKCMHHFPHHQNGTVQEVSELRFNLPTKSSNTATVFLEKRSSYLNRLHGRAFSSEDGDETPAFIIGEDGRMDLTLGQEKAGGGFGGKQAKLGKLIIQPEGLKMLDLLVAANVGLWWRAYEKT